MSYTLSKFDLESANFKNREKIKENVLVLFKNLTAGAHLSAAHPTEPVRAKKRKRQGTGVAVPANSPAAPSGGRGDGEGRELSSPACSPSASPGGYGDGEERERDQEGSGR